MRYGVTLLTLGIIALVPFSALAAQCSSQGFTVIFVNGVLNEVEKATANSRDLQDALGFSFGSEQLVVKVGHNQSHIAGLGDFAQSVGQIFDNPISYYDRDTILRQIHSEVTTRKVLLVGHSQGTFYTNELYSYLVEHGVPRESIAVYNLATPANRVAGGGAYLTSGNDQLVLRVRQYAAAASAPEPLQSNILIPISAEESTKLFGGHSFSGAYLTGAAARIVRDIEQALSELKASGASDSDGCFIPPPTTVSYKVQKVGFAALDPLAKTSVSVAAVTGKAVVTATQKASAAAAALAKTIGNALSSFGGKTKVSASTQGAAAASAVPQNPIPAPRAVVVVNSAPPPTPAVAPVPPVQNPPLPTPIEPHPIPPPPDPVTAPAPIPAPFSIAPGFGGDGGASAASAVEESQPAPVVVVPLAVTSPDDSALFGTSSVTVTGTTTSGFLVALAYGADTASTTADTNGDWSAILSLPEGVTAVGIVASDADGNTSDALTRSITVDTTPPDAPAPVIDECSAFGSAYCEIVTTIVNVSWSSVADAIYYALTKNAAVSATTTATTLQFIIDTNATTTFSVAAYDLVGNGATSADVSVHVNIPALPPPPFPPPPMMML
ncbi:hypothetical protein A3C20_00490 [Candidatus Kaiserbacteria bacterium RIFCSPHIGHO2_02_FULL_55_25]|uniref:Bacterial Ig domain-containing protein n=1 Tax=Candidatus Kaiserbacteria bacterium RIFCSPHIGHO2_02_FULL_55_25 TaxID=1798498 RepID=A0A1F6E4T8_9BACT|nr:MAG: hypothetical protein A2764_00025 [Candidatus Kaiserbacteria bacterium RIFCSPHIGHO2_01_FULL_55_79]OGG68651.1 MAG: hypothetical protein A3C20_00490 [Candidatus Kaiserbacteria bacterium RIFCSPHIGHO2_02_FULL_55_25]OGG78675.1 MAG: hypothetical protein A3F56_01345 [Candidatus Kaiserbacteria bacterium RIFCSPHIGHO2_12_FULL_55_13]OGG83022.1 MAG: hypothetical protein A3A42_01450 [Candidatus Kaiserbacteria bacterium RIFCSPLOWO2_01_FULL_55_25]